MTIERQAGQRNTLECGESSPLWIGGTRKLKSGDGSPHSKVKALTVFPIRGKLTPSSSEGKRSMSGHRLALAGEPVLPSRRPG